MKYKYIDAHAHIHGSEYSADRAGILERMREARVGAITVGTHLASSKQAAELARNESDIWATVGVHPTDTRTSEFSREFYELALEPRVVGIGECGLDYFRGADDEEKKRQEKIFRAQIELAGKIGKPLMIHGRPSRGSEDAYEDIIRILKEHKNFPVGLPAPSTPRQTGNIHFFSGSIDTARKFLEIGFTLSFTGVITFTKDYDEVVRFVPLDMLLSETDCPYVSPVPYRGKRNEPSYVVKVAERIAELKDISAAEAGHKLSLNAERVFKLS